MSQLPGSDRREFASFRLSPPGKNILSCESAVEIRGIGWLLMWDDELLINGRSSSQPSSGGVLEQHCHRGHCRRGRSLPLRTRDGCPTDGINHFQTECASVFVIETQPESASMLVKADGFRPLNAQGGYFNHKITCCSYSSRWSHVIGGVADSAGLPGRKLRTPMLWMLSGGSDERIISLHCPPSCAQT